MSADEDDYVVFDKDKVTPTEMIRLRDFHVQCYCSS